MNSEINNNNNKIKEEKYDKSINEIDETTKLVRQLVEIGAYEQAAAVSRINNNNNNNNTSLFRGLLHGNTLHCVHIGVSSIHSRGLITNSFIPRGTRIITEIQQTFMDPFSFLPVLADTYIKLPDTYHYTHPTGVLLELITRPLPHHLMNHSCEENVCCGLSQMFWSAVIHSGNNDLIDKIKHFKYFEDPNSYFTTRDILAGEELTLNYSNSAAPLFTGEDPLQKYLIICRCNSVKYRHFVYRSNEEIVQYLLQSRRSHNNNNNNNIEDDMAKLLGFGLDDETVLLSLLNSREPLMNYMQKYLLASRRTATKGELLICYRHVFKLLNEASPKGI